MPDLRLGIVVPQDALLPELRSRWQRVEEVGFDLLYLPDVSRDWRAAQGPWFDCWTLLPAVAAATSTIRIGTLVSNQILRPAATLARAALTVDHLSDGRLELGLGTGIAAFDHEAMGIEYWSVGERVRRFAEWIEILDGLLRTGRDPFFHQGEHLSTKGLTMAPPAVQQPRPPITVGGRAPTVRRMAIAHAQVWNLEGPFGATIEERIEAAIELNAKVDHACEQAGRDPASLRRSYLLYEEPSGGPFHHAWEHSGMLAELVERFAAVGIQDFVVVWPEDGAQRRVFEHTLSNGLEAMTSSRDT